MKTEVFQCKVCPKLEKLIEIKEKIKKSHISQIESQQKDITDLESGVQSVLKEIEVK